MPPLVVGVVVVGVVVVGVVVVGVVVVVVLVCVLTTGFGLSLGLVCIPAIEALGKADRPLGQRARFTWT